MPIKVAGVLVLALRRIWRRRQRPLNGVRGGELAQLQQLGKWAHRDE